MTPYDRLLKELDIIENLFKAQSQVYDPNLNLESYPSIQVKGKGGVDGRYICLFHILSDFDFLNIWGYKKLYTDRFDSVQNQALLLRELEVIRKKAQAVVEYGQTHLSAENQIVSDFLKVKGNYVGEADFDFYESHVLHHSAVIKLSGFAILSIYLGADDKAEYLSRVVHEYSYIPITNSNLVNACRELIKFANLVIERGTSIDELHTTNHRVVTKTGHIIQPERGEKEIRSPRTFEENFSTVVKYKNVIKTLQDNNYIDFDTNVWIDTGRGHRSKILGLFEHLRRKEFFTARYFKPAQRVEIIKEAFGVLISPKTAEKALDDKYIREFSFIN